MLQGSKSILEPNNVRIFSHPVCVRWIKLLNLAIYIAGYLDGEKLSQRLVFRTFVGALVNLSIEIGFFVRWEILCKKAECIIHKMLDFPSDSGYT